MIENDDESLLLTLYADVIDATASTNIPQNQRYLADAQVLSVKLCRHFASLSRIMTPAPMVFGQRQIDEAVDFSTGYVVARAAFEASLVFSYIFGHEDIPLRELRYAMWKYAGMSERQKFVANLPEGREKQAREAGELAALLTQMKSHPGWSHLKRGEREPAERGKSWRGGLSWTELGRRAGLEQTFVSNLYAFLCGYAHTSWASVLQVGSAPDARTQAYISQRFRSIQCTLLALAISDYLSLFPAAETMANIDETRRAVYGKWCGAIRASGGI